MPNGHPYIPRRMNQLRKMRWLRKRAQHWAFHSGDGRLVIRWHGGTMRELEYGWRFRAKRHCPFVPGLYMRPELRERFLVRQLLKKI